MIGGLRVRRLFFPASSTNICDHLPIWLIHFNSIETTFTCSVLLSSSSESGKSLMGTKPVPDQEELREISSKGIQRRNEKEKQEKHPAFSHCLNPLRVCTSLLSQIGIKNRPKIYWNLLEIRSKREIISKRLVASCCTATEAKS